MDGWNTFSFLFPFGARPIFRGEMAVSFREGLEASTKLELVRRERQFYPTGSPLTMGNLDCKNLGKDTDGPSHLMDVDIDRAWIIWLKSFIGISYFFWFFVSLDGTCSETFAQFSASENDLKLAEVLWTASMLIHHGRLVANLERVRFAL